MTGTVPTSSIVFMAVSCLIGFAIPLGLFIYFRKKKGADILPFFVGCAIMLVFALILESMVHRVVLSSDIGSVIQGTIWLYALYGGAMAGLFEETGRFIAFKTVLRKRQDKDANALMYGAGHGGFEAAMLLGITMINNLVYSMMINSGNVAALTESLPADRITQIVMAVQELIAAPPYQFLLGGAERIFAVTMQISLSVLVWFSAKKQGSRHLYPLAILIHLVADTLPIMLSGIGMPVVLVEAVIGIMAVLVAVYAKRVWDAEASA